MRVSYCMFVHLVISGYRMDIKSKKKVKLSRYTPWRHMGGEEV
jgi:hypothetical protein